MSEAMSDDFSEPEEEEEVDKIGIFWNAEAYPFPDVTDPDSIYEKIESGLDKKGVTGEIAIYAYVDEKNEFWDEFLRKKKTWKKRLHFVPRGDENPHKRMLNDILLWKMESPAPSTLIIVSDQVRNTRAIFTRLSNAYDFGYSVFMLDPPTGDVVSPEEWPGSLLDRPFSFSH